jgi:P27 family predicted phage terminase small subunit
MSGPAPLPTAVKKLRGNPGGRKLNPEPDFGTDRKPACPAWLDKDAKAEWRAVVNRLYDAGIVKSVDRSVLAAYCVAFSRWRRFEKAAQEFKLPVLKSEGGNWYMNPAILMAQSAMKEMLACAAQLGMTPSARSKIVTSRPVKEKTLADILFDGVE